MVVLNRANALQGWLNKGPPETLVYVNLFLVTAAMHGCPWLWRWQAGLGLLRPASTVGTQQHAARECLRQGQNQHLGSQVDRERMLEARNSTQTDMATMPGGKWLLLGN